MASELAEKLTRLIRSVDKLTRDMRKDTQKVLETLRELKELTKGDEKEEDL